MASERHETPSGCASVCLNVCDDEKSSITRLRNNVLSRVVWFFSNKECLFFFSSEDCFCHAVSNIAPAEHPYIMYAGVQAGEHHGKPTSTSFRPRSHAIARHHLQARLGPLAF